MKSRWNIIKFLVPFMCLLSSAEAQVCPKKVLGMTASGSWPGTTNSSVTVSHNFPVLKTMSTTSSNGYLLEGPKLGVSGQNGAYTATYNFSPPIPASEMVFIYESVDHGSAGGAPSNPATDVSFDLTGADHTDFSSNHTVYGINRKVTWNHSSGISTRDMSVFLNTAPADLYGVFFGTSNSLVSKVVFTTTTTANDFANVYFGGVVACGCDTDADCSGTEYCAANECTANAVGMEFFLPMKIVMTGTLPIVTVVRRRAK